MGPFRDIWHLWSTYSFSLARLRVSEEVYDRNRLLPECPPPLRVGRQNQLVRPTADCTRHWHCCVFERRTPRVINQYAQLAAPIAWLVLKASNPAQRQSVFPLEKINTSADTRQVQYQLSSGKSRTHSSRSALETHTPHPRVS